MNRFTYLTTSILIIFVFLISGCSKDAKVPPAEQEFEEPVDTGYWDFHGRWRSDVPNPNPYPRLSKPDKIVFRTPPSSPEEIDLADLPDELPYPMTPYNRHIWTAALKAAVNNLDYLDKILPDEVWRATETMSYLADCLEPHQSMIYEKAMWAKLLDKYPNDPEVLFFNARHTYRGTKATRAEKLAYIDLMERLKVANDANNIPLTSGLRKTYGLSQFYVDVGEYQKAIDNIEEQNRRIGALKNAGLHHRHMYYGLMRGIDVPLKLLREQQAKAANGQNK